MLPRRLVPQGMLWKVTAAFVDADSHVEQPLDEPSFARIRALCTRIRRSSVEETDGMPKDEYATGADHRRSSGF